MISHDGRRWRPGVSRGKGRGGEAVRKDVCLCVLGVEGRGWQRMLVTVVGAFRLSVTLGSWRPATSAQCTGCRMHV